MQPSDLFVQSTTKTILLSLIAFLFAMLLTPVLRILRLDINGGKT